VVTYTQETLSQKMAGHGYHTCKYELQWFQANQVGTAWRVDPYWPALVWWLVKQCWTAVCYLPKGPSRQQVHGRQQRHQSSWYHMCYSIIWIALSQVFWTYNVSVPIYAAIIIICLLTTSTHWLPQHCNLAHWDSNLCHRSSRQHGSSTGTLESHGVTPSTTRVWG
jgi:hypothetical protein